MMDFKPINNFVPSYLSSMFTERLESGYAIRDSANKLTVLLLFKKRDLAIAVQTSSDLRREISLNRCRYKVRYTAFMEKRSSL